MATLFPIVGTRLPCRELNANISILWGLENDTARFPPTPSICLSDTPDAPPRKLATSTQSLVRGSANQLSQRKRILRAPTLAELESSESDVGHHKRSDSVTNGS